MYDLWGFFKSHSLIVTAIGFFLFLFSSFFQTIYPIILLIVWWMGICLFIIGIISYFANQNTPKQFWKNFFRLIVIIGILLGIPIMLNNLDPKDVQNILNVYIPIDIAVICITFAILTINPKDIIKSLKTNQLVDIELFKWFIVISMFTLFLTIFDYLLIYFKIGNPLTATIFGITIYAFNTIFWVITFFTLILIANLIFYTSTILEEIFKTEMGKEQDFERIEGRGGKGGDAEIKGNGIAIGGPGGQADKYGVGGDGGSAKMEGDGDGRPLFAIAVGGAGGAAGDDGVWRPPVNLVMRFYKDN